MNRGEAFTVDMPLFDGNGDPVTTGTTNVIIVGDGTETAGSQNSGHAVTTGLTGGRWKYTGSAAESDFTLVTIYFVNTLAGLAWLSFAPRDDFPYGRVTASSATNSSITTAGITARIGSLVQIVDGTYANSWVQVSNFAANVSTIDPPITGLNGTTPKLKFWGAAPVATDDPPNMDVSADSIDDIVGAVLAGGLTAVKTKTDQMVFTVTNKLDSNPTNTAAELNAIADAFLNRDMSVGTDSGSSVFRTPRQALRHIRNKWTLLAGVLTVYKEDDTNASWTSLIGVTPGASPITSSDPAG